MGSRTFEFAPGEFYHLYNRGVEKRTIFLDQADYQRFVQLLYVANTTKSTDLRSIKKRHGSVFDWDQGEQLVAIGAYCLMPNHFHLLVTPRVEHGVSQFMNKLGTSYSMYFNYRYERTGGLFEGKFKAKHAASDRYLKYLYSYVHLNPVKLMQPDWNERGILDPKATLEFARTYQYSSLSDLLGVLRPAGAILESKFFPEYFTSVAGQEKELLSWLDYEEEKSHCSSKY